MAEDDSGGGGGGGGGEEKLRILCLHSFRTSAAILRDQLFIAQWPSSLGDLCEFTFVDSPHLASGEVPPDVASFFEPPYKEWWNAMTDEKSGVLEYVGLDESLASIDAFVAEHGPFDGVLGFSQGATLTGMLAASGLAEGKGPFASSSSSSSSSCPTFALMISGMLARTERARALYAAASDVVTARATATAATGGGGDSGECNPPEHEGGGSDGKMMVVKGTVVPSLHIIGEADGVLPPALSRRAASSLFFSSSSSSSSDDNVTTPVIVQHERGHVVPRLEGEKLEKVRAFLTLQLQRRRRQRSAEEEEEAFRPGGGQKKKQTPSASL